MRLEATFCKKGVLRYISHLDLVRLFQRSIRRAELPVSLSEGYTPHYRISFGDALKLGLESEAEKAVFTMDAWMGPEEFKLEINKKLPEGVKVIECRRKF